MTEIKILIYTDTKNISLASESAAQPWSVSILRDILEAQKSAFLTFKLDVINRYEKPPQARKIDDDLLESYDQVWVFGKYQSKVEQPFDEDFGGPDNELGEKERDALEKWMTKGGILIAGDHSNPPPHQDTDKIDDFLGLGKALGFGVPRAGELRKWVGEPTIESVSSFNTLSATALLNVLQEEADSDAVPQKLLLEPVENLPRHPIMNGTDQNDNDRPIDLFPDHIHEGEVAIPAALGDKWPPQGAQSEEKPPPIIIARGCDKRHCRSRPVLAVYDPPPALNVGRIVADSTWHHYFNVNLQGLRGAGEGSAFFMLKQYYRHVAFFLTPLEKRQEVSRAMLDWTLRHPEVWEVRSAPLLKVGGIALQHLSKVATRYEIFEMLQYVMLSKAKNDSEAAEFQKVDFPQMSAGIGHVPPREIVVGAMINSHYKEASKRLTEKNTDGELTFIDAETAADARVAAAAAGIKEAFDSHKARLAESGAATEKYLQLLG